MVLFIDIYLIQIVICIISSKIQNFNLFLVDKYNLDPTMIAFPCNVLLLSICLTLVYSVCTTEKQNEHNVIIEQTSMDSGIRFLRALHMMIEWLHAMGFFSRKFYMIKKSKYLIMWPVKDTVHVKIENALQLVLIIWCKTVKPLIKKLKLLYCKDHGNRPKIWIVCDQP